MQIIFKVHTISFWVGTHRLGNAALGQLNTKLLSKFSHTVLGTVYFIEIRP